MCEKLLCQRKEDASHWETKKPMRKETTGEMAHWREQPESWGSEGRCCTEELETFFQK